MSDIKKWAGGDGAGPLANKKKDAAIMKLQGQITAKRKAGFDYSDPEMKKLMDAMEKLTGKAGT
jgi:hypothetical protein